MDLPNGAQWLMLELKRINDKMEQLGTDVSFVKERVVAIEAAALHKEVEQLEARIAKLEAGEHQRSGALKLADWVRNSFPWLAAAASFAWAWFHSGK
jgi:hypothetical protein